jgi:hypothetical protein
MPFDSNGVFSRVMNWTSDQQNGIAIECGRHDAEDDNFAQGFNDCFCRDGRAAATGDFNLGNYKVKNVAAGTATTDAVNKGQLDTGLSAKATPAQITSAINTMLATLYPVGSLYIGTQNSCPLASLISGSQWQIIATDCALWGGNGSNGNTWIPAGLPNITGQISCIQDVAVTTQGQFAYYSPTGGSGGGLDTAGGTSGNINFDASRVSSIYGNSNTVQPPAYRVNVWRRTA